jgi:hypothetical protein
VEFDCYWEFLIKSMYVDYLKIGHTIFLRKYLWKLKVPLKIKMFMGFLYKKFCLQRIILLKEGGMGVQNVFYVILRRR